MIDDLSTRAALTVAAFLLLATGLSILDLFGGDAVEDSARDLATHLARELDIIGATDGELTVRAGLGGAIALPPTLAGSSYRIDIHAASVHVSAGTALAVVPLRIRLHPFAPSGDSYTRAELSSRDVTSVLSVEAGDDFIVERTARFVDAVPAYLTFVHLPR